MSPPIMSRFDLFFVILDEFHEATDWAIARHIVNFHRLTDEGVDPAYTIDQLYRYLSFARSLKPQLTNEAKEYLVTQYRNLRQADATGINKSSYRITVRQLESMVRLSEALAKLYAEEEILVRHVTEAAHLLKTSIVHVEQDEIELDDDEELDRNMIQAAMEADMDEQMMDANPDASQSLSVPMVEEPTRPKNVITLTAEEYQRIVQQVIFEIRKYERETGEAGMHRSRLVDWYLESKEAEIESEEQVVHYRKMIKSVLNRLVKNVIISNVII
jgi:DNA replication licensing factor MCM6